MPMKPFLSVIVPSFNEHENIKRGTLDDVLTFLQQQDYAWELILSDDGSTDGTTQFLEEFAKKYHQENIIIINNIHAGKAPTVKAGMLAASGEWRLYSDFDQSTPLKEVKKLLAYAGKFDVIFGSREMIGAKRDKEPFHRHFMGRAFNLFVQLLTVPGILDTQCGFKLFSEKAVLHLFNSLYVYDSPNKRYDAFTGAFDVELLYLAQKYDYKLIEVPVVWKHYPSNRVSPLKDSLRMLRDITLIRLADWRKKYDPSK